MMRFSTAAEEAERAIRLRGEKSEKVIWSPRIARSALRGGAAHCIAGEVRCPRTSPLEEMHDIASC